MTDASKEIIDLTPEKMIERVTELASAGQFDKALALTEKGIETWPAGNRLRLSRARVLAECDRGPEAIILLTELLDGDAGYAASRQLASVFESHPPNSQDAIAFIDAALERQPSVSVIHTVFEALLEHADQDRKAEYLAHIALHSGLHRYEWRHANRLIEQGFWGQALELIERAYSEGRTVPMSATTLAELMSVTDRHDDAITVLRQLIADDPENTDAHRKLVKMAQRANAFDQAGHAIQQALEKWPDDWMLVQRMNRLPVSSDMRNQCHRMILAQPTDDPRLQFQQAIVAVFEGRIDHAVDLLAGPFPGAMEGLAEQIRRILRSRESTFWRASGRLEDDRLSDVQVVPAAGSETVVIVPSGVTFGLLPLNILDALLAERGISAIYLKDFNKRVYVRGVRSLGNAIEDTVQKLDEISASIGAKRKIFLGCSSGGYAAHRLAALSGAYAGVSFAGPVNLATYCADAKPAIWNEEFLVQQILQRNTDIQYDNVPLIKAAPDTRFLHYYGHNWPRDVAQASLMSDLERVELIGDSGADHLVVNHMIADGRFGALLDDLTTAD